MLRFPRLATVCATLLLVPGVCWGRGGGFRGGGGGFGGGGFHGGGGFGGGGFGGGGFGGGARPGGMGGGGFGGGGFGGGGFGGGGFGGGVRPGGDFNSGGFGGGGFRPGGEFGGVQFGGGQFGGMRPSNNFGGGNFDRGNSFGGGNFDRGNANFGGLNRGGEGLGNRGLAPYDGGDRFANPSRGELNNFLGLPSDEGLHGAGGNRGGDNFDVNYGTREGPRGGEAAGISVTGPRGNTAGRAVAEGPRGGVAAAGGVRTASGTEAARGAAVGPGGRVAAGGAIRGPHGGAAAAGAIAGPRGAAAGFARVTPSGRYTAAAAVRSNYNHWGVYGRGWYTDHPGAWYAAGWAANAAWNTCAWSDAAAYCSYYESPIYYEYGNNVTYQDDSVYLNGAPLGTTEEYYDQASAIASTGAEAVASSEGDWLPLGVFALTRPEQTTSDVSIQLAINREGIIRGNYTDTATNKTQIVKGSVDKQTQRVAFTVGDDTKNLVETGLYNLTKDEAPALLHFGQNRTEQWLLVRLKQPPTGDETSR